MEDQTRSLSEVAGLMGVSERTVRRWIKAGRLRAYKPGRDYRIPESSLRAFIEESEISPKGERRSSLEISFNDMLDEERHTEELYALQDYIHRRARHHEVELKNPTSPHFKDATTAALWVAMIDEEREGLIDFILDKARPLIQQHYLTERPPLAMRLLWPVGQLADVAQQAEERLDAMNDQPDELAARKREKARVSAEDSERRLAELQDTGS